MWLSFRLRNASPLPATCAVSWSPREKTEDWRLKKKKKLVNFRRLLFLGRENEKWLVHLGVCLLCVFVIDSPAAITIWLLTQARFVSLGSLWLWALFAWKWPFAFSFFLCGRVELRFFVRKVFSAYLKVFSFLFLVVNNCVCVPSAVSFCLAF